MDGSVKSSTAGIEPHLDERGQSSGFAEKTDITQREESLDLMDGPNHSKDLDKVSLDPGLPKDAQTQTGNDMLRRKGILKFRSSDAEEQSNHGAERLSTSNQQVLNQDGPLTAEPDALPDVPNGEGTNKSTQTSRTDRRGFAVRLECGAEARKRSHVSFDEQTVTVTILEKDVTRTEES